MATRRYDIILYRRRPEELSLEALAARAGLHPALVERLVQCGLIEPIERDGTAAFFDLSAVPRLRLICRLREGLGLNIAGVAVVLGLLERFSA
ncbi:MAG TPA: chaperone modulator CbpM, partial [Candidatus Binatia bacterium]